MTMSSADWEVLSDGPERFEDGTLPFLDIVALRHGGACCWGDGAYLLAGLLGTCLRTGLLPAGVTGNCGLRGAPVQQLSEVCVQLCARGGRIVWGGGWTRADRLPTTSSPNAAADTSRLSSSKPLTLSQQPELSHTHDQPCPLSPCEQASGCFAAWAGCKPLSGT